ncbi:MAG: hypothetical protein ING69_10680 [Rhodocyclaceae bacterium]|nr:hypothetical protein [Rhodocyclaceae bacterium]
MSTKPSLSALMKRAAHGPAPIDTPDMAEPPASPAPPQLVVAQPVAEARAPLPMPQLLDTPKAASRTAKKPLSVWVTPEARRTLRQLAAEQDRTIESMIGEGLNDLFQKYQKPRLA